MKQGWTYKKLGEVCEVLNGLWVGKKEPLVNIAVIRNTNFSKDCKLKLDDVAYIDVEKKQFATRKLQVGDIIIEKSGGSDKQPVGRPVLFNIPVGDYSFSNFTSTLRIIDKNIFPRFLHYCLYGYYRNGETKKMQSKTTGLRNLDMKAYLRLAIPYLVLAEQERIVAELDLLSGIIEKKKAQLKAYDRLAQSIFYTMFGDIEEDTPVSEYISALSGGKSLAGETECKNKVLKTGAVTYDYFRGNEVKNLPTDYQPIKEHLLNDGDILISRMNTLGYVGACAYVWKAPLNTYLPDRLWRATLKDNINPIFLWFSLIQDKAKEQIRSMASGTSGSMKNISIPRFLTVKIKCIPLSLQREFAEKVEAIERQKALVQQSIEETQTLFDYTMDKYFG